jgi:hypothetical protein
VRETGLGGNEAAGLRPLRATCGCADAGIVSRASPGPAELGSSNRASLSGRAEGRFSGELGTARSAEPG